MNTVKLRKNYSPCIGNGQVAQQETNYSHITSYVAPNQLTSCQPAFKLPLCYSCQHVQACLCPVPMCSRLGEPKKWSGFADEVAISVEEYRLWQKWPLSLSLCLSALGRAVRLNGCVQFPTPPTQMQRLTIYFGWSRRCQLVRRASCPHADSESGMAALLGVLSRDVGTSALQRW